MSESHARMNVESFNLDHRFVKAPYVRVADVKRLPHGDVLTKYDIRFCQPNREHLEMPAVHSIEHSFAEYARNHSANVVDFSPMGCQTGFYLILAGEPTSRGRSASSPAPSGTSWTPSACPPPTKCSAAGGANHSLTGAQEAVRRMLEREGEWGDVSQ